jgi:hypothetical protein
MGYGEDGQPVLIYAHHDTDNNHLHIVTSRVAPDGHKINDHHERVRSQEVISRIMGESQKQRASDSIKKALEYHFSTVKQFQAVLESMGYQCYERDNQLCIKRDGCVIERLNLSDISSKCQSTTIDEKRQRQLRAILLKYRDMSADKEELKSTMKQKFGIDLIFHGSKDKPYGYTIIDHQSKTILKGSEVLKLKELLQFHSKQERLHRMDEFIDAMLDDNPDLTTRELNRMLRRQFGTHISKGRIACKDDFIDLQDYQIETLRANDHKAWLKAHPLEAANHQQQATKESNTIHIQKPSVTKEGSRDQNREWEVGHKSNYDEVDDERQLKR